MSFRFRRDGRNCKSSTECRKKFRGGREISDIIMFVMRFFATFKNDNVGLFTISSFLFIGVVFFGSSPLLRAQNIEMYLSLIREGRIEEVRTNLPELLSKYPAHPGVLYLKALTTVDGDSSIQQFRRLIERFPNSEYADDAGIKIGEYLYARGLYSQASVQLRNIPLHYPASSHLERAMRLMVRSYQATGEVDSARHYLRVFKRRYPDIDYSQFGIPDIDVKPEVALVKVGKDQAKKKIASSRKALPKKRKTVQKQPKTTGKPWVVQVGAFSKYANAKKLKLRLSQSGYQVVLGEVVSNGRRLHTVRVVRYASRSDAIQAGKELKRKFGLDFRVLKNPE